MAITAEHGRAIGLARFRTVAVAGACAVVAAATLVVPYLQNWGGAPFARPDADIPFAYQALLIGDLQHQQEFSHTGYIYFVFLSIWYRVLDMVGVLPVSGFRELMDVPDKLAVYADLVQAGRAFSMLTAALFSIVVFAAILSHTKDYLVATIGGVLFAAGEGNAFQTIVLRTELLASFFAFLSFVALLRVTRETGYRALTWLFLAGLFASLSYNVKIHLAFTLAFLPLLAIAFGREYVESGLSYSALSRAQRIILALVLAPIMLAWLVLLVRVGRLGPLSYIYVPATIVYCAICTIAYKQLYRVGKSDHLYGAIAVAAGFGCGIASLFLFYDRVLFYAAANPLEHMAQFVLQKGVQTTGTGLAHDSGRLIGAVTNYAYSLVSGADMSANAYRLLIVVCGLGTILLAGLRRWRAAIQIALLVVLVVAQQSINSLRYTSPVYSIISDPWMVFAFCLLLHELRSMGGRYWRAAVLAPAVGVAYFVVDRNVHAASVDWTQPASNICVQANGYLPPNLAIIFEKIC